jgi:hypothetical protein
MAQESTVWKAGRPDSKMLTTTSPALSPLWLKIETG